MDELLFLLAFMMSMLGMFYAVVGRRAPDGGLKVNWLVFLACAAVLAAIVAVMVKGSNVR